MSPSFKAIYVGSFRHNLDAKNRLTIPSKWRFAGDEEEGYLAAPHPEGYITVLPPTEVERLYQKVSEMRLSDREAQDFLHRFFANTHAISCDKQGRIHVASELTEHAGIQKETIMVGTMTRFAI